MDWLKIGKGILQGYILSPCLFNICRVIMQNAWLEELQAGIKILGEILITSDVQITPSYGRWWRGTKESLDEGEVEKAGLKLNIQKMKIMAYSPITSWQVDWETVETLTDLIYWVPIQCRWWPQLWNYNTFAFLEEKL